MAEFLKEARRGKPKRTQTGRGPNRNNPQGKGKIKKLTTSQKLDALIDGQKGKIGPWLALSLPAAAVVGDAVYQSYRTKGKEDTRAMGNNPLSVLNPMSMGKAWKPEWFTPFKSDTANRLLFQSAALSVIGAGAGLAGHAIGSSAGAGEADDAIQSIRDTSQLDKESALNPLPMAGRALAKANRFAGTAARKANRSIQRNPWKSAGGGLLALAAGDVAWDQINKKDKPFTDSLKDVYIPGRGIVEGAYSNFGIPAGLPNDPEFWSMAAPVGALVLSAGIVAAFAKKRRDAALKAEPIVDAPLDVQPGVRPKEASMLSTIKALQGLLAISAMGGAGLAAHKYFHNADPNRATIAKLVEEHKTDNMRRESLVSGLKGKLEAARERHGVDSNPTELKSEDPVESKESKGGDAPGPSIDPDDPMAGMLYHI